MVIMRELIMGFFGENFPIAWNMRNRLFGDFWVIPSMAGEFLLAYLVGFGRQKDDRIFGKRAAFSILWCLWAKRNARIFKD